MNRHALSFRLELVAVAIPLFIAAIGILLMVLWIPDLPPNVVVHWGPDGVDYGPVAVYPSLVAGAAIFMAIIFGLLLASSVREGHPSSIQKLMAVAPLFVTSFVTAFATTLLAAQRGMPQGAGVQNPAPQAIGSTLFAIVLTGAAWLLLPKASDQMREDPVPVEPLIVAPGERIAWSRRATAPRSFAIILMVLSISLVAEAFVAIAVAGPGFWFVAIIPLLVIVSLGSTLSWDVRVDETGLSVRSALGVPRFLVPLADVASVSVVDVHALADFGGWGLRWGRGRRFGVIVRGGEALSVLRKNGKTFVVTVDDARGAASALAGLVGMRPPE